MNLLDPDNGFIHTTRNLSLYFTWLLRMFTEDVNANQARLPTRLLRPFDNVTICALQAVHLYACPWLE